MRRFTIAVAAFTLVVTACSGSTEGVFGEELYEQSCSVCHRSDGSGGGSRPAIDAGSEAALLSDDQIAGVIRSGPGAMPAFGPNRLTDDQVASLVDYVRRLQGETG